MPPKTFPKGFASEGSITMVVSAADSLTVFPMLLFWVSVVSDNYIKSSAVGTNYPFFID
jgi:hypothetical protein